MLGQLEVRFNRQSLLTLTKPEAGVMSSKEFPFATVVFCTPTVSTFKYQRDAWIEWYREVGIKGSTHILFHKAEFFWSFSIALLGFGVYISLQNGY